MLGADHQFRMAGEDQRQRVGAFEAAERGGGRHYGGHALLQVQIDELRDRFGIGFGGEFLAGGFQLRAQGGMVFDDAVMHDRDTRGAVRMGVAFGRCAVGCPARVADTGGAGERRFVEQGSEVGQLAAGAPSVDVAVHQGRDAGAVVAAIFQPAERIQ